MTNIKILSTIPEDEIYVTIPIYSKDSDKDFVKLMKQDTGTLTLQFSTQDSPTMESLKIYGKETANVDYIYTGLKNFWTQVESGSSTVFFECLHTQEFITFWKQFSLEPCPLRFYSPHVAKAYLDLAEQDLRKPGREQHVLRCIWMARKILANELINLQDVAALPSLPTDLPYLTNLVQYLRTSISYKLEQVMVKDVEAELPFLTESL